MEQILKQLMDHMDKQFAVVHQRLENVDQQLYGINQRLDKLDNSIQSLEETVQNNAVEFRSYFQRVEDKLDRHDKMFTFLHEAINIHVPNKKLPFRFKKD
ncbi:hypothetical protein [Neobacillus fumarioli]|uniref:hypothetical protein n=1 Tax=Neobacillus fumarioli TaxID=105229 RepID=UPI0008312825|nr:hypothetical protein [Neobacillus fumarioli]